MVTKGSKMEFNLYSILAHLILTFVLGPLRGLWLTITARTSPHLISSATLKVSRPSVPAPADPKLGVDCPYEYILQIYGRNHFAGIVNILNPTLAESDPIKFQTIMEIMDVTHFAAILVDDVVDNSSQRKGKPAAHTLWGGAETINRSYLRLVEVLVRTQRTRPELVPIFLENLAEIHEGQDISLVWRRDGAKAMPKTKSECLKAYRRGASLKTGALFRLVGQLVTEDKSKDELMTRVGYVYPFSTINAP